MGCAEPRLTEGHNGDTNREERRASGIGLVSRQEIGEAIQFHQQGEYERAVDIYCWYHTRDPDNARVLQLHGLALQQIGEIDGAVDLLSRSIAIDPTDAPTHSSLGNLYYLQGRSEDALKCFALAIEADPQSADAYNDQGNVLRERGSNAEAIENYRKAIAIDASLATPHFNLGNALWDIGDVDAAMDCYRTALEIDPSNAAAHNNLGNAYRTMEDLSAAVQSYACAASCDPSFALARFNLANTHKDLGDDVAALSAYRDVLALEPENALARHMVAALAGESSEAAPEAFVRQVFDSYAGHFDSHLGDKLGYRVPETIREAVVESASATEPSSRIRFDRALDLGCGTGLVAEAFRDDVTHFVGVDLSPRMLSEARTKGLYETLIEGELVAFLQKSSGGDPAYDAVLAADSFIYIGDLSPVFVGVADCLAPGGVFAFSIEIAEAGTFELLPTGRFAQSESYVRGLAEKHGFAINSIVPTTIRLENGKPVNGVICVLIKASALA